MQQSVTLPVTLIGDDEWTRAGRDDDDACFGALETARGNLPLEAMDVRASITGLSYRIRLRQTFVNNLDEAIEATYIFPLPDRGAVTSFHLRVADREIEGDIAERGAARRQYAAAIETGHRAAIAEEERSGVFTMRVGNLIPGDRAAVELTVIGALELEEGCGTFRFPLVVAPRYIPGRPLEGGSVGEGVAADTDAVPDASRITPPVLLPGYPNPVRLGLAVDIDPAGLPISNLRCALHSAITRGPRNQGDGGPMTVELQPGERLDRDFVLRFDLGDEAVATSLVASPDPSGEGGTFCLTALPPRGAVEARKPRDVVFVLDRSGSMDGWKMIAARRAVARMVDGLDASDRFAVIAFDSSVETPASLGGGLVAGSDRNRFRAVEFLAGLEARGGTEMLSPLRRAAEMLGGGYRDRERVLVLATDGQVGNEDQILRELAPKLSARVFTLGIDRAVNAGFLRRLAILGAGSFSLVESEDRLDEVMDQLHRRIGEPLITELALAGEGFDIDPDSLVPRRLPDLFAGSPLVIWGRYRGEARGKLLISGADGAGGRYRRGVAPAIAANDAAAPIWARGRIRDLEDVYAIGRGDRQALAKTITALSIEHKVLCRFTAFVAVDKAEVVNAGGNPHEVIQPVEIPDGWAAKDAERLEAIAGMPPMQMVAEECSAPMDFAGRGQQAPTESDQSDMSVSPASMPGAMAPPMAPTGAAGAGAPKPPAPSAPRPPEMKLRRSAPKKRKAKGNRAPSRARGLMSKLLGGREAERSADVPSDTDWTAVAARSIADRLTELLERHRRRDWMPAANRIARLVHELEQLASDLRSLSTPDALVDKVFELARKLTASDPVAAAEAAVEALVESLRQSAPANDQTTRRDQPFWR